MCGTTFAIALLGAYIVAMDWIPIARWNDNIRGDPKRARVISSIWHGALCATFATAAAYGAHWAIFGGALWFAILLAIEVNNWWLPYLFGTRAGELSDAQFSAAYERNWRFLPRRANRALVPDAQHVTLQLLTIVAAVASWLQFAET